MCVNDVIVQGAAPLFFLDYFACGRLDAGIAARVIAGIAEGCRQAGAALIGGETAEMPGLYAEGDYDLAGFCVGAAERGKLLPREDIAAGDTIIGIASQGLHSNGFSLARKIVRDAGLAWSAAAPFDLSRPLGEVFLDPTRIYAAPAVAAHALGSVKGFAHITGGGLPGNVPRILPDHLGAAIDLDAIRPPAVFGWLAAQGKVPEDEMLRVFNCGIGLVAVAAPGEAATVIDAFEGAGDTAYRLGVIERRLTAYRLGVIERRLNGAPGTRFAGRLDLRS
jgi:phosphoribosylformylglycinamidine cyclo-ligase